MDENNNNKLEEKKILVQQIEQLCGKNPHFYFKFTSCKKFAEDIINGKLYSNTASYFRKLEVESGFRGQGDQYELINVLKLTNLTIRNCETNKVIMNCRGGTLKINYFDDDNIPIISLVGIPLNDMELVEYDNNHATFALPFTCEEYKQMEETFGKYCVLIDGNELNQKIKSYAESIQCDYLFDKIRYCKQNSLERMQSFNKSSKERFLYKNDDLKYQREYRIAFAHEIPENHFINLGKFNNAYILDSSELKNFRFTIKYVSQVETK